MVKGGVACKRDVLIRLDNSLSGMARLLLNSVLQGLSPA